MSIGMAPNVAGGLFVPALCMNCSDPTSGCASPPGSGAAPLFGDPPALCTCDESGGGSGDGNGDTCSAGGAGGPYGGGGPFGGGGPPGGGGGGNPPMLQCIDDGVQMQCQPVPVKPWQKGLRP